MFGMTQDTPNDHKYFNSLLPKEFFYLRKDVEPKVSFNVLWIMTVVIYSIVIVIFVLIFMYQSKVSSSEAKLSVNDLTNDEWMCNAVSPITNTFPLSSLPTYDVGFTFVEIVNSQQTVQSHLTSIQPCMNTLVQLGPATNQYSLPILATTPYSKDYSLYLINGFVKAFNASTGLLTTYVQSMSYVSSSCASIQLFAQGVNNTFYGLSTGGVTLFLPNGETPYVGLLNPTFARQYSSEYTGLLNDNLYQVYAIGQMKATSSAPTVYAVFQIQFTTSPTAGITNLLFTNTIQFGSVAAYSQGNDTSIYYSLMSTGLVYAHNCTSGGTTTLFTIPTPFNHVVNLNLNIDASIFYLTFCYLNTHSVPQYSSIQQWHRNSQLLSGVIPRVSSCLLGSDTVDAMYGFTVTIQEMILYPCITSSNVSWQWYNISSHLDSSFNYGYENSKSSWFVCNDVTSPKLLPTIPTSLENAYNCSMDGILWQLSLDSYFLQTDDMMTLQIEQLSLETCTENLYTTIAFEAAKLGPFICSRDIYQPFLTVLSVAVSNSHTFLALSLIVIGAVMSYYKQLLTTSKSKFEKNQKLDDQKQEQPTAAVKQRKSVLEKLMTTILPSEFYYYTTRVNQPKASITTLILLTVLAFSIASVIFVLTFVSTLNTYVEESNLSVTDMSDTEEEWTCSLASIITNQVYYNQSTEPSVSYEYISVSEVYKDCVLQISNQNPCNDSTTWIYSVATSTSEYNLLPGIESVTNAAAVSSFVENSTSVLMISLSSIVRYDLYDGTVEQLCDYSHGVADYSIASGPFSRGFYFASGVVFMDTLQNVYTIAGRKTIPSSTYAQYVLVSNDASQRLYLCQRISNTNYEIYSLVLTNSTTRTVNAIFLHSFGIPSAATNAGGIFAFIPYFPHGNVQLPTTNAGFYYGYFMTGKLYIYRLTSQGFISIVTNNIPIITMSTMNFQLLSNDDSDDLYIAYGNTNSANFQMVRISSVDNVTSPAYQVESYGKSLVSVALGLIDKTLIYISNYDKSGSMLSSIVLETVAINTTLLSFANNSKEAEVVYYGYSGTTIGWNLCGNTSLTAFPQSLQISTCESNEIIWNLTFQQSYLYPTSYMKKRAYDEAYLQCHIDVVANNTALTTATTTASAANALYESLCEPLKNNPPFLCTRKDFPTYTDCFFVALSSSHIVLEIIVFVVGTVLIFAPLVLSYYHVNKSKKNPQSAMEEEDVHEQQQQMTTVSYLLTITMIPTTFFSTKQYRTLKATWTLSSYVLVFVVVCTMTVFITMFIQQQSVTQQESIFSQSDLSADTTTTNDGWSCAITSYINEQVVISGSNASTTTGLVNNIYLANVADKNAQQCLQEWNSALMNPCANVSMFTTTREEIVVAPITTTSIDLYQAVSFSSFPDSMSYFISLNSLSVTKYVAQKLSLVSGIQTLLCPQDDVKIIATGKNNSVFMVTHTATATPPPLFNGQVCAQMIVEYPITKIPTTYSIASLVNDNYHNLFLIATSSSSLSSSSHAYSLSMKSPQSLIATATLLNINSLGGGWSFTVYTTSNNITDVSSLAQNNITYLYTVSSTELSLLFSNKLFRFSVVLTDLSSNSFYSVQVNSHNTKLYLINTNPTNGVTRMYVINDLPVITPSSNDNVVQIVYGTHIAPLDHCLYGSSGVFSIVNTAAASMNSRDDILLMNCVNESIYALAYYNVSESQLQYFHEYSDAKIGWYYCDEENLFATSGEYELPVSFVEMQGKCSMNAYSYQVQSISNRYITDTSLSSLLWEELQSQCTNSSDLYRSICENVEGKPPYYCTRMVNPSIFETLGICVTFSHFVYSVLIIVATYILPYLVEYFDSFRLQVTNSTSSSTNGEVEMKSLDGATGTVTLANDATTSTITWTENPLSKEETLASV